MFGVPHGFNVLAVAKVWACLLKGLVGSAAYHNSLHRQYGGLAAAGGSCQVVQGMTQCSNGYMSVMYGAHCDTNNESS